MTPRIGITSTIPIPEEWMTVVNLSTIVEATMAVHFPMIRGEVDRAHLDFLANWINFFLTKNNGGIVFYSPELDGAGLVVGWYMTRHRKKSPIEVYQLMQKECSINLTADWIRAVPVPTIE